MKLAKINTTLLICIILVNGYIILTPLALGVFFQLQNHSARQQNLEKKLHQVQKPNSVSRANRLIVPGMLLDQPILDGPESQQYQILNKGIWRFNSGSTPDRGSNTVLIGHRFTYTNPRGVFYYLNKVKMGDEIGVWWGNEKYLYKVVSIKEVPPNDTAIENNTARPKLTLFTCTPLWLPKDRLVVVADLEVKP